MNNFVGFNIGSLSSYVSIHKKGSIETALNKYGDRNTPTCVSFTEKLRLVGTEASQRQAIDPKNTIDYFMCFLGHNMSEDSVKKHSERLNYSVEDEDNVLVTVNYLKEKRTFSIPQLLAAQFGSLEQVAKVNCNEKPQSYVVNMPLSANQYTQQAYYDAAKIAGITIQKFIHDTTAIALSYGFFHRDNKQIIFIDMGACNLQMNLVKFSQNNLNVLACHQGQIGGLDFTLVIYHFMVGEIKQKYNLTIKTGTKASVRLIAQCEKLKKQLSTISGDVQINVECLMDDIDVSLSLNRDKFEELSVKLLDRLRDNFLQFVVTKPINIESVDEIKIVGGSTRIPAVKDVIVEIFNKQPNIAFLVEDAVSIGCAIQNTLMNNKDIYYCVYNQTIPAKQPKIESLLDTESSMKIEHEIRYHNLQEKIRYDVKNELEEYIYEVRPTLDDKTKFNQPTVQIDEVKAKLTEAEEWLYNEGENCEYKHYVQLMNDLQTMVKKLKCI